MKKKLFDIIGKWGVWEQWRDDYKKYVPKFIQEASSKTNWQDWDKDVFYEFFEKSNAQCVSSLRQGYFSKAEQEDIKKNWGELAPLLKKIADHQDEPQFDCYQAIKEVIRKYTTQNKKAATNRLIAGLQPNLLCTIINEYKLYEFIQFLKEKVDGFQFESQNDWFKNSHAILQFYKKEIPHKEAFDLITLPWQTYEEFIGDNQTNNDMSENMRIEETIELLKYKKQIILQGPPGTGKTKLAKELALYFFEENELTNAQIKKYIVPGMIIRSAKNYVDYRVLEIENDSAVKIQNESNQVVQSSFVNIKSAYKDKIWDTIKISSGPESYAAAIAKYLYYKIKTDHIKLLQFHPSYTYEDFVRGIIAKPNEEGDGILYEAENKLMGTFAKTALQNYADSQKNTTSAKENIIFKSQLEQFIDAITEEFLDTQIGEYSLTDNVYIFYVDDKRFKYKGDNWEAHPKGLNMNFSELEKIIATGVRERSDIKKLEVLNALTKSHATYYAKFLEKYDEYIKNNSPGIPRKESLDSKLNNYVLIIDEINRANLSSVLGELIYALEYRGQALDGMYEVDGIKNLIIPPNLYIIGTMNTADRSVGHIDYAIRRRFAFVEILPEDLSNEPNIKFETKLFHQISDLFKTNLSGEFDAKDLSLGHSYFIHKYKEDENGKDDRSNPYNFDLRLEYEIKPILLEYVKDGILIGEKEGKSIKDYISSLKVDNEG